MKLCSVPISLGTRASSHSILHVRIIGLYLGKKSVGWAVLELNDKDGRILAAGARCFPAAEQPKKGESPNLARRLGCSNRRRLRRVKHRLERLRILFVKQELLAKNYLSAGKPDLALFDELHRSIAKKNITPYQLRFEGLERKLSTEEWIIVLTHCAKRLGFRSNIPFS